jgi:glutamyl-Q tRNA(Asp) synthetase
MPDLKPGTTHTTHSTPYKGRFAPSPTGPLHMGSLVAALASFLDARHHEGSWIVRMEDLDPPREEAGAAERILHSLDAHNLQPDEPVLFQSRRLHDYDKALQRLNESGLLFQCDCSRAQMGAEGICRGDCRSQARDVTSTQDNACAERVAVRPGTVIHFDDRLLGTQTSHLEQALADFVVKRKDGLHAYQLAVVVDDAYQEITHIVRGSDLLDSTPRQIYLQQLLGYDTPHYCHVPVLINNEGKKLSKQNHAPAIDDKVSAANLRRALVYLRQPEPPPSAVSNSEILAHAIEQWSIQTLPTTLDIPLA